MSGSYLVLTEFVLAFLFHSISIGRILLILKAKFTTQRETSIYFLALLLNWLVVALLLLPYEGYGISVWRPLQGMHFRQSFGQNCGHVYRTLLQWPSTLLHCYARPHFPGHDSRFSVLLDSRSDLHYPLWRRI